MENERPFEVGDEVVTKLGNVGRVIRITPKAKRVVVDFGNYEDTYSPDGFSIGDDIWFRTRIMHMTPEIKRELEDKKAIALCKDVFKKTVLSAGQARLILEILKQPGL
jgi:hypothetical protein